MDLLNANFVHLTRYFGEANSINEDNELDVMYTD